MIIILALLKQFAIMYKVVNTIYTNIAPQMEMMTIEVDLLFSQIKKLFIARKNFSTFFRCE